VHIDRHPLALGEQVGNADWRDGDFLFHGSYFTKCSIESAAERLVLAAGCHENQPTKRNHVFERKKALKQCVANRPLQTMLGRFCKAVLNLNLRFPIITAYIGGRCFH
jgi:hypothetical protein